MDEIYKHMRVLGANGVQILEEYVGKRIEQHHKTIETARGDALIETQGMIQELRKLQQVLAYVKAPAQGGPK